MCGKYFLDAEGKNEVTQESVVILELIVVNDNTAEISEGAVDAAISKADKNNVTLELSDISKDLTSAILPVESFDKLAALGEDATLTLHLKNGTVVFDANALKAVAGQAEGDTVTLEIVQTDIKNLSEEQQKALADDKVQSVLSVIITSNGKPVNDFGDGSITVIIPFKPEAGAVGSDYNVMYVSTDGKTEKLPATCANGSLSFTAKHGFDYAVINVKADTNGSAQTGDAFNPVWMGSFAVLALAGVLVVALRMKRKEQV